MKFITFAQCRAARGLLGWSQQELAKKCDMHKQTISNFEANHGSPSKETIEKITHIFEIGGIEFIDSEGVRLNRNQVIVYEGQKGIRDFFDDVYKEASSGCEINLFNGVPNLLIKGLGKEYYDMHAQRMLKIKDKFSAKIIVEESEKNFIATGFAEYRGFPKDRFNNRTIYIYGSKVGFFTFSEDNVSIRVFVSAELAASMRVLFDIAWDKVAKRL